MQTTISSTNNVSIVIHLWDGLSDVDKDVFEAYQSSKTSKEEKKIIITQLVILEIYRKSVAKNLRDPRVQNILVYNRRIKLKMFQSDKKFTDNEFSKRNFTLKKAS